MLSDMGELPCHLSPTTNCGTSTVGTHKCTAVTLTAVRLICHYCGCCPLKRHTHLTQELKATATTPYLYTCCISKLANLSSSCWASRSNGFSLSELTLHTHARIHTHRLIKPATTNTPRLHVQSAHSLTYTHHPQHKANIRLWPGSKGQHTFMQKSVMLRSATPWCAATRQTDHAKHAGPVNVCFLSDSLACPIMATSIYLVSLVVLLPVDALHLLHSQLAVPLDHYMARLEHIVRILGGQEDQGTHHEY